MARKRMIDPSIWDDEGVSKISFFGRLMFIGMFSQADDYGKGRANAHFLKSKIFPYDDVRVAEVEKALSEIGQKTSVQFYEVNGQAYYRFRNWERWQKVEKPTKSVIPDPEEEEKEIDLGAFPDNSPNPPRKVGEDSPNIPRPIRIEKEDNISPPIDPPLRGQSTPKTCFVKPTVEEVKAYCTERGNRVDSQDFWDFYESKGWKVGNTPMKDWRACVRRWEKSERGGKPTRQTFAQREYAESDLNDFFANEV